MLPSPGTVKLSRSASKLGWSDLIAIIAHECGHAITREREFEKRDGVSSEWASELCADFHAFRWGFEKQIRAHAHQRSVAHHCVLPGEVISMESSLGSQSWKVDRNFYLRPLRR